MGEAEGRFHIVFMKLSEESHAGSSSEPLETLDVGDQRELEEIDELRRLSVAIERPSLRFFSGT